MAKDPAVLWYYRDYLQGTEEMSWAEQGAYSRLLNKQADKGHLSIDSIKKTLKKDFERLWPGMADKFITDADGNFYNERMDIEVRKRAKNSQTQKDRIQKYWNEQRNSHGNTTEYSTVIPIANAIANAKAVNEGGKGETRQPIVQAMADRWKSLKPDYPYSETEDFHALFEIGKFLAEQIKSGWLPETDVGYASLLQAWTSLSGWAVADDFYKSFSLAYMAKTRTLQTIWQKSKEVKNGTTTGKNHTGVGKAAGANELAEQLAAKLATRGASNPGG